jgi:hypothetical protein
LWRRSEPLSSITCTSAVPNFIEVGQETWKVRTGMQ